MDSSKPFWEKVYKKKEEIVSREIAGEMFLVPVRGRLADMQQIFTLNPVAEYIWRQLDGEKCIRDISEGILSTFDVEREEADADLEGFIAELLESRLIEGIQ